MLDRVKPVGWISQRRTMVKKCGSWGIDEVESGGVDKGG